MQYELSYIIKGDSEETKAKEISEDLIDFISKTGENPKVITQPKIQPLAYPIKKQTRGFWGMLEFGLEAKRLPELEKKLKESKEIIRFMLTKKRVEKEKKKVKKEKGEEKQEKEPKEKQKPSPPKVEKEEKVEIEDLDKKLNEILKEV